MLVYVLVSVFNFPPISFLLLYLPRSSLYIYKYKYTIILSGKYVNTLRGQSSYINCAAFFFFLTVGVFLRCEYPKCHLWGKIYLLLVISFFFFCPRMFSYVCVTSEGKKKIKRRKIKVFPHINIKLYIFLHFCNMCVYIYLF